MSALAHDERARLLDLHAKPPPVAEVASEPPGPSRAHGGAGGVTEERPDEEGEEGRHRRGLRFRKREDYAVELFREAQAHLDDVARVDRILLELGRFYNPFLNEAIVDSASRRRILESLQASRPEEARRLLDRRLSLYARFDDQADEQ